MSEETPDWSDDVRLAQRALAGDHAALQELDAVITEVIPSALARSRVPRSWGDEVAQRVRSKLLVAEEGTLPRLHRYEGRGPLRAWVRVTALRTGIDMLRSQRREETLEDRVLAAKSGISDPEVLYLKQHYATHFREALTASLADLDARDRRLLKLRILDDLNIDAIGALHGVHRATAARWLESAREALGKGVRARLERQLDLGQQDLGSVLRLIRSQLDLSLHRRLDAHE